MKETDVLSQLKDSIKEELNREANKTIDELTEKMCHKLRCQLGKHKRELVAEMLDRIDIIMRNDGVNKDTVFQINIRGGKDAN